MNEKTEGRPVAFDQRAAASASRVMERVRHVVVAALQRSEGERPVSEVVLEAQAVEPAVRVGAGSLRTGSPSSTVVDPGPAWLVIRRGW